MNSILFRLVLLGLTLSTAAAGPALDAFSNLFPTPEVYSHQFGYSIGDYTQNGYGIEYQGFQFTTTASGILSGFQLAMNESDASTGLAPYTLELRSNGTGDTLGSVLGTYTGLSTGEEINAPKSLLSSVVATGAPVSIESGTRYWLVAYSAASLAWNPALTGTTRHFLSYNGGAFNGYGPNPSAASLLGSIREAWFLSEKEPFDCPKPRPCTPGSARVPSVRRLVRLERGR